MLCLSANAASVIAAEAATSAELASVDARITSAVQVASAAATSADGHANTASVAAADALSVGNAASVVAADALSHAGAASAAATSVEAQARSAVAATSATLDAKISAISAVGDSYTWTIKSPAAGRIPGPKIYANQTVKKISGNTVSADTTMTYNVEKTVSINAAGANLMSDNQVASINAADTTTIVGATLTANSYLALSIAAVSGTPSYGIITVVVSKP